MSTMRLANCVYERLQQDRMPLSWYGPVSLAYILQCCPLTGQHPSHCYAQEYCNMCKCVHICYAELQKSILA